MHRWFFYFNFSQKSLILDLTISRFSRLIFPWEISRQQISRFLVSREKMQCLIKIQQMHFFRLRLYLVCMKCLLIPWDPQSNLNKVQLLRTLRWQSYKSINSLIPSGWEEPSLNDSARFVKGAILLLMLHVISFFRSTICNSIGFYPILASKFETWARYHGTNTNLFLTPTSNFPLESDLKKQLVIKDLV